MSTLWLNTEEKLFDDSEEDDDFGPVFDAEPDNETSSDDIDEDEDDDYDDEDDEDE